MIRTRTTFVIGAGASHGLPTGMALKQAAIDLSLADVAFQLVRATGVSISHLQDVLGELRADTTARSIDEFLESRWHRKEVVETGRALIAVLLGIALAEAPDPVVPETEDWLGYIIRSMRDGTRTCGEFIDVNHGVRFVTFNFDDRIERRLAREVRTIFPDATHEELKRFAEAFRVVHLHGRLPEPPHDAPREDPVNGLPKSWVNWLVRAAKCVRVVHDDDMDVAAEAAATQAVQAAEVVCFLGFAYARTNVRRLGIPATTQAPDGPKPIFGSAYGLAEGERILAISRLAGC